MDGYLKQSTAGQTRWIGPFIDDTDFKTARTALTINNTDIYLGKNGGSAANKNSGGGAHHVNGLYAVTWDALDTATVGELKYSVKMSGALHVFGSYVVLEEAIYDALIGAGATGYLQPTTPGRTLDVSATGEAGVDWANVGSQGTTVNLSATNVNTVGSVTGNVGGGVVGSVGSLGTTAKSDVHAEIVNALNVDTYPEPSAEAPGVTISLAKKIGYLYKAFRNKVTQTSSQYALYSDNDVTVDQKSTVADDGTTFTKGKVSSGP